MKRKSLFDPPSPVFSKIFDEKSLKVIYDIFRTYKLPYLLVETVLDFRTESFDAICYNSDDLIVVTYLDKRPCIYERWSKNGCLLRTGTFRETFDGKLIFCSEGTIRCAN